MIQAFTAIMELEPSFEVRQRYKSAAGVTYIHS